jgi:hypothetical protein
VTVLAASGADAPGTLGFLVVFGMGVVLFFVFRSMAKHLRKVSSGPGPGAGSGADGAADPAQAAASAEEPASGGAGPGDAFGRGTGGSGTAF